MNRSYKINGGLISAGVQLLLALFILFSLFAAPILKSLGYFPLFVNSIYLFYSTLCHQMPSRSLFLLGEKIPVCVRCFGIYLGLFLALIFLFLRKSIVNIPNKKEVILIIFLVLPMAVDGFVQLLTSYQSNNPLRFITGLLFGIGIIYGFSPLLNLFFQRLLKAWKQQEQG